MLHKPSILVVMLVLFSAFSGTIGKPHITRWVIMKGGSLKVDGSTNVNKFSCVIANHAKPDTITIYRDPLKETLALSGVLRLDVQSFDCHNPVMTGDLRKTLKARQFPQLSVRFLNLSKYPNLSSPQDHIKGAVAIALAGVTRRFEVDYKVISVSDDVISLIGSRQVNFSDFNIVPPRKIGGMIQTNNELGVVFSLRIKVIN